MRETAAMRPQPKDVGSLEHNRNFWAQKLQDFRKFWAKESDCSILQFLGPEILEILQFPGPEIALMLQSDLWARKLRKLAPWIGMIFVPNNSE